MVTLCPLCVKEVKARKPPMALAEERGCPVDFPRNLAKSVTVEQETAIQEMLYS